MLTVNNLIGFNARVAFGIAQSGTLFACGSNTFGQLGLPVETTESKVLIQVGTDTDWAMVSCGKEYTIAIKTDGTMWGTGRNDTFQLGLGGGDTDDRFEFTQISDNSGLLWKTVSAGGNSVLAITQIDTDPSGFMYGWGINNNGQLGLGTFNNAQEPTQVGGANTWTQAFCGNVHSAALQGDQLLLTGSNGQGQLGRGSSGNQFENFAVPNGGGNWLKAAVGDSHSIGLRTDGTIQVVGNNNVGQLGLNSTGGIKTEFEAEFLGLLDFIDVACNSQTSHAITAGSGPTDQRAYGCGNNNEGQIGDGTDASKVVFTQISNSGWGSISGNPDGASFILLKEQDMWGTGRNDLGQLGLNNKQEQLSPDNSASSNDWSQISAGQSHCFALVA